MRAKIERRAFMTLLGGTAAAWSLAARAQQPRMPLIGFLRSTSLADATYLVMSFRQGLQETGYVAGDNVAIENRSAEDHPDRLSALVEDLISRHAAVVVGNHNAALVAKAATAAVPIVVVTEVDPVGTALWPASTGPYRRELSRRRVRGEAIGPAAPVGAQRGEGRHARLPGRP